MAEPMLDGNMDVFREMKANVPDSFLEEFLRLANRSPTMQQQLWDMERAGKRIVWSAQNNVGKYDTASRHIIMGLQDSKIISDPFAPPPEPGGDGAVVNLSPVQVFVGVLAHELGHFKNGDIQSDVYTKYPLRGGADSGWRYVFKAIEGEAKASLNAYIIRKEIVGLNYENRNNIPVDLGPVGVDGRNALKKMGNAYDQGNVDEAIRVATEAQARATANESVKNYLRYYWDGFNDARQSPGVNLPRIPMPDFSAVKNVRVEDAIVDGLPGKRYILEFDSGKSEPVFVPDDRTKPVRKGELGADGTQFASWEYFPDGSTHATEYDPSSQHTWTRRETNTNGDSITVSQSTYNDDGTHVVTTFDAANNQAWTWYSEAYNALGQHTEDNWIYDDGRHSRYVFDANNDQAWTWYSEAYNALGQRTEDNWIYDDGRRYQRWYDPHNTDPDGLSGGGNSYNAAGTWTGYEWFYDDGRRTRYVYDVDNTQPWSSYTEYYNTSGQHTEDIWYHDGGGRNRNVFDFNNNQPWSSYSEYYNASGQHTEDVWYRDDGGRNRNVFDVNNNQPWSSYSELFDASGRNTDGIRYYDDGRRDHWQWDPANTQTWSSRVVNYNPSGQWTTQSGVWDDGTTFQGEWRTGVPYYMWSWKIETYDQNGNMTRINGGYPDGWTFNEIRDPYNSQPWSRTWNDYDQNGVRMENQGNYDNGGWWHTWYDPYNTQGWTSFTQMANSNSEVFKEVTVGDDGSVTERRIRNGQSNVGFGLGNLIFKNLFDPVNLLQTVLFGDSLIPFDVD